MKKTFLILSLVTMSALAFAQTKKTTSATVSFDASTPKDALPKADNKTVVGEVNTKTGEIGFEAAVKNFAFTNEMIQNHFNGEKWMNSAKFPVFTFTGKITDLSKIKFDKAGNYTVPVSGELTVRDVTKPLSTTATFEVKAGSLIASTSFSIKLADYGITGAPIEAGKIAPEPKITVSAELK
ncbi:MAG: YceI family protein [Sphingobacteriales bacterium]|nr:YceI family protein [Sphingobacteriales bacterium]